MEYVIVVIVVIGFVGLFLNKKGLSFKERKQKGDEYEKKVGKFYEDKGYEVNYNGLVNGIKDQGIDLICKKENEIILIQCKNWDKYKIKHLHIKAFHSDCIKYIEQNELDKSLIKLKYVVPKNDILHNSAIKVFKDKYYNCRYEIV